MDIEKSLYRTMRLREFQRLVLCRNGTAYAASFTRLTAKFLSAPTQRARSLLQLMPQLGKVNEMNRNELIDPTDGENLAVRAFLRVYSGTPGLTIGLMKRNLEMSGYPHWPEWVNEAGDYPHLSKLGAQNWLRHLFALEPVAPIDMVLFCPACGKQHIDAPDPHPELRNIHEVPWTNPPHRSHLCHGCGHIWRPADVPTNGVQAVKTVGKADSPIVEPAELAACKRDAELAACKRDAERLRLELLSCSTDCIYLQEITENKQNLHGWLEFRRKAIDAAMAAGEKA